MRKPLRVGLIGCGWFAQAVHLPILRRLPEVELIALAEPDPNRRQEAGRCVPAAQVSADYRDLLNMRDLDAVIVSVPTALHAEVAIAALRSGKHVYLEKPIATSLGEADKILSAWKQAGVVGMVGFNYRFNALHQAARTQIQAGKLGPLVGVRSVFSTPTRPMPAWKQTRSNGGGVLLDLASHHIDVVRFLFEQEVRTVSAEIESRCTEHDTATVHLELCGGLQVQSFGEGVTRTEDTFAQVLEDTLNQRQQALAVKVLNFGASAYSVKEMAATLQYRTLEIQPDLVVMAIIPSDFNWARTPTIDESGYLIDQRLYHFSPPGSLVRRVLRQIRLTYVLRDIVLRWFFAPPNTAQIVSRGEIPETYEYVRQFKKVAEERGHSYVIALLPGIQGSAWGNMPDQLSRDAVTHIDLSFLGKEFTEEQYMASRFDPHPSAAVHHRIGESLADYVQHQPGFVQ